MNEQELRERLEDAIKASYYRASGGMHNIAGVETERTMQLIAQYGDTRERLGRIDELSQMNSINLRAAAVVPRVSSDNRNPVKRMNDHIFDRLAELKEKTNDQL